MNLTREDMLRELELLPVWQLRTPPMLIAPPKEKKLVVLDEKIEAATEVPVNASVYTTSIAKNQEIIISDDKKWAFICSDSAHFSALQRSLFNNILLALRIDKTHTTQALDLANIDVGVVVLMGELTAQSLLKTDETLETLRGKVHALHHLSVIVTYHPQDLLLHLPTKAKTWDDLCLALGVLSP